jgi:hypothetical protein
MLRLLRDTGFEVEACTNYARPTAQTTRCFYLRRGWAQRWPGEEPGSLGASPSDRASTPIAAALAPTWPSRRDAVLLVPSATGARDRQRVNLIRLPWLAFAFPGGAHPLRRDFDHPLAGRQRRCPTRRATARQSPIAQTRSTKTAGPTDRGRAPRLVGPDLPLPTHSAGALCDRRQRLRPASAVCTGLTPSRSRTRWGTPSSQTGSRRSAMATFAAVCTPTARHRRVTRRDSLQQTI